MYQILIELIVIFHFLFILFVVAGGFFVYKKHTLTIIHLCAVAWAIYAELSPGIVCPLTQLENYFASLAGLPTYREDFVTRYLIPVIYQENIPEKIQYVLIAAMVCINLTAYGFAKKHKRNLLIKYKS